ncbi:P-loop containing nucleoside triphosphate hydrolase protein [Mycena vulgaris]|nr:P-loop containing nucleoside triphosphate hydrolase protein [Mycena vulgaris]
MSAAPAPVASSAPQRGSPAPTPSESSNWLANSLLVAKTITAAAECAPFPSIKGAFGLVVILLEMVEKVKKNRDNLKELCEDVMEIMTIVRDQLVAYGDKAAVNFKNDCEKLASMLQDILKAVKQLQKDPSGFWKPYKTVLQLSSNTDQIGKHRMKIQNLRSNLNARTFNSPWSRCLMQGTTNCPPPSRHFHGRTGILEKMRQFFNKVSGEQHIFLLHGLGGSGKTQTALKFIQESSAQFSDVFLIDASTTETIASGLQNIAMARGLGNNSDDALRWLQSKPSDWLLLFDNADDPKLDLNKFLPKCSHGSILLTSRNHGLRVYAGRNHEVKDMEEVEAEELLLKSAELELTPANRKVAAEIVKVLCYLALAIIQAGAFIAVSEDLTGYLESYAQNRARLLSEKPTQSHDDYAWTVYTTWQISFDRLSEPAAAILRLCSFLHHNKISEGIFSNASKYKCRASGPSQDELEKPFQFLSHFLGPTGSWDSLRFRDITKEIRGYSLIYYDQGKKLFSMHPLVHDWCRDTLLDPGTYQYCMSAILGMAIKEIPDSTKEVDRIQLLPHVHALTRGDVEIKPDFRQEYGNVYWSAGVYENAAQLFAIVVERWRMILGREHLATLGAMNKLAHTYSKLGRSQEAEELQVEEAEELQVEVLEKRHKILGDEHPDTLGAMENLASTYSELGRSQEAEELQVEVLEKRHKILGDEHPDTLGAMENLACTCSKLGRLQEAEERQVEVLEKMRHVLGREHPATLRAMNNLASTYSELGRSQEAEELQVEILEKRRKILGDEHPDTLAGPITGG